MLICVTASIIFGNVESCKFNSLLSEAYFCDRQLAKKFISVFLNILNQYFLIKSQSVCLSSVDSCHKQIECKDYLIAVRVLPTLTFPCITHKL